MLAYHSLWLEELMMMKNKHSEKEIIVIGLPLAFSSLLLAIIQGQTKPNHFYIKPRLDSLIKKRIPLFQFQSIFDKPKKFPVLF